MVIKRITFAGSTGAALSGALHLPDDQVRGVLAGALLHGPCTTVGHSLGGAATVDYGGRPFPVAASFLDDLAT